MTDAASLRRPITIAHRYGNNLARLAEAKAAGADFVECDVWLRDGRLEVRHEHTLGPLPIWYDKWKVERTRRAPLLSEILAAAAEASIGVMIDLKGTEPAMPSAILDAVAPHLATLPMMVSARSWRWLPDLRAQPELMLFHSIGDARQLRSVRPLLDEHQNDAVSIHSKLLNAEVVRSLKDQVSLVATWPINDDQRLADVLAWGVDAIISDDLAILGKVERER